MYQIHAASDDLHLIAAEHFRGDDVVVILRGDVDRLSVPQLREYLDRFNPSRSLHLDLGQLEFIDVSGALLLYQTAARFRDHGGSIVVCDPPHIALRLLDLLGISQYVDIEIADVRRTAPLMST